MRTMYCIALAGCVTCSLLSDQAVADPSSKPIQASVEDIGNKLVLIGRLKRPLGTMMTIRGKWHYPSANVKDNSLRFTVTHVDGVKLDDPVTFNVHQLSVVRKDRQSAIPDYKQHKDLEGVEWTLRAYESGRFDATPMEYWRESNTPPPAAPYWFNTFTSQVNGVLQP